jgi:hypothetical protein
LSKSSGTSLPTPRTHTFSGFAAEWIESLPVRQAGAALLNLTLHHLAPNLSLNLALHLLLYLLLHLPAHLTLKLFYFLRRSRKLSIEAGRGTARIHKRPPPHHLF